MIIRKRNYLTGLVLACTFFFAVTAHAEDWSTVFGGSEWERGNCVEQTTDGGYIIAGYTESTGAGSDDLYLIKTDSEGNELWSKTIGGSDIDVGFSIQQTLDGGFIIAGFTMSFGAGREDVYLVKTDGAGNEEWSKTFGTSGLDGSKSVQQTSDGGYILVGDTEIPGEGQYDVYLIKTDSDGNEVWNKTFGGTEHEVGYSVRQTNDGGYIIAGNTGSFGAGESDIFLIKTDPEGNKMWSRLFGGSGWDRGFCVRQTRDGGYIIVGDTESTPNGIPDIYLIKTGPEGRLLWSKNFGGDQADGGFSVNQTTDGGYIIIGNTESEGAGAKDIYIIKTDNSGNEMWSKTYGGELNDEGRSVCQTFDSGFIITGYSESFGAGNGDLCLIHKDPDLFSITMAPDSTIIPKGGDMTIEISIQSRADFDHPLLFYTNLSRQNGEILPSRGYFTEPINILLHSQELRIEYMTHTIPLWLPEGTYTYNGYLVNSANNEKYCYSFDILITE